MATNNVPRHYAARRGSSTREDCLGKLPVCGLCAAILTACVGSAQAQESAHQALVSLAQDITYSSARLHPTLATALGIPGHDGELEAPSETFRAAHLERVQQWKSQLGSLTARFNSGTSLVDRDDAALLEALVVLQLERVVDGSGGHPGTCTSTGTTSATGPSTPYPLANSPQLIAQSPTATTIRGSDTASNVRRNGTAMLRVTGPVTSSASAWRGEATSRAP